MKKILLIQLILMSIAVAVKAQDSTLKKSVQVNTEMTRYPGDSSANAFVISEHGDASIRYAPDGGIRLFYFYINKTKILNEQGFKYGTIEIPIYGAETIFAIMGNTVYKDSNGKYVKEKLTVDKIYKVQENKYQSVIKFALPALKPGCEIEYSYTISSPYFSDFHSWHFEGDLPKIHSEFQAHIPTFLTYNISLRGALNPTKNVSSVIPNYFAAADTKFDCKFIGVTMDNVPAFIPEDFMTAPKNYTSALYFELSQFINPNTGDVHKLTDPWSDIDKRLKDDDNFGDQIKRKSFFKDRLTPAIAGKTGELDKAQAIYAYLQKNIKWNEHNTMYSTDIRKALDKHVGTTADINLALVSALTSMGLNAEAVLLSTRDHGVLNKVYPVITEFNYIIAKVNIGDKSYLLDATDPLLSFGMLPLRCLNDQGRVISLDKPSYWTDVVNEQGNNSIFTLNLTLQDNGKLKGTFINYFKGYAAYNLRKSIKKFNTVDEYVENLDEKLPKVKITKSNITNIDSLNLPISETFEIEVNALESASNNKLSFNPYMFDRITINPLKQAERTYPVDWGMPSETKIILQVQLPENYTIENPPENIALSLPNQAGGFTVKYDPGLNSFIFSHTISFKKSIYQPDEYPDLKELYNKIILTENTEMVFKKKI